VQETGNFAIQEMAILKGIIPEIHPNLFKIPKIHPDALVKAKSVNI